MTVHLGRLIGLGREAGTALIEMVMLGFAIVVIVVPTVTAVVGLADARARASTIAHDTAVAIARHGAQAVNLLKGLVATVLLALTAAISATASSTAG